MAKYSVQGVAFIVTAILFSSCEAGMYLRRPPLSQGGYYYEILDAIQQASSCQLQVEAPSKTFTVCVKQDGICTSRSVPACSSSATNCQRIGKDNKAIQEFEKQHPDVYAEECKEPSGEACLYTDVAYNTCSMQAKAMEEKKLCVKLSDGTRRCSDIGRLVQVAANDEETAEMPAFKLS